MFDIGFLELLVTGVLALLIMGPERLPGAIRTGSRYLSKIRRSFNQMKSDIEREFDADEIKRQIHNDSIMQSLEKTRSDIDTAAGDLKSDLSALKDELPYDISDLEEAHRDHSEEPTIDKQASAVDQTNKKTDKHAAND